MTRIGEFELNRVSVGDCLDLARRLPAASVDMIVTSPPYWGQRTSNGVGVEDDPRVYLAVLTERFGDKSDIDMLVEFETGHTPGLLGIAGMEIELSELLGRKVDLVPAKYLSRWVRDRVLGEAEVQYAR